MSFFGIIITFAFAGNIVLVQCLGWCPLVVPPKKPAAAIGSACAVAFAMTCSSAAAHLLDRYVLLGPVFSSLRIMAFMLLVAGVVFVIDQSLRWFWPALHRELGAYVPGVSANCAILGTVFLSVRADFNLAQSALAGFAGGAGFLIAHLLLSVIREKLSKENVPRALRGAPIAFITAGLLALGFIALDVALLSKIFGS